MSAAVRTAVAASTIAILAGLSMGAFDRGTAGSAVYAAAQEMATWTAEPGAQTVRWLIADLDRARQSAPDDPNIEELLGALATHRIDRPEFLDEALVHYRRAVELRPTSPYAWADIAAGEYRKGDVGAQFQAALRRAAELGPAEPEVQRTVLDFGLATWDEVAPETRKAVEATITGAMKRDARETLQTAERRGRLAIACRHLSDAPRRVDPEWPILCRSREATS